MFAVLICKWTSHWWWWWWVMLGEAERFCHEVCFETRRCVKMCLWPGQGSTPDPARGAYSAPRPLSWIWGRGIGNGEWIGLCEKWNGRGRKKEREEKGEGEENWNWGGSSVIGFRGIDAMGGGTWVESVLMFTSIDHPRRMSGVTSVCLSVCVCGSVSVGVKRDRL